MMAKRVFGLCSLLVLMFLPMTSFGKGVVLDFPDTMDVKRKRPVPLRFHLPKEGKAQSMVVVSHGAGGSRDALFALAEELAQQGYVVMCLEHVTSNTENIRERMNSKGLGFRDALVESGKDVEARKNRPLDVTFAIDFATRLNREDPILKGRINLSRIAMIGHSYGAYTTMVCCGAKPVTLEGDFTDPRVKLGIALSPQSGNGHFFDQKSFQKMTVPFVGISGNKDRTQFLDSLEEREDCFKLSPKGEKHFLWFYDAGHFSFSDASGSERKVWMKPDRDVTNALKKMFPASWMFISEGKGT